MRNFELKGTRRRFSIGTGSHGIAWVGLGVVFEFWRSEGGLPALSEVTRHSYEPRTQNTSQKSGCEEVITQAGR